MNEQELIFSEVLNKQRTEIYSEKLYLDNEQLSKIYQAHLKRKTGYPIQYILGKTEFMGLEIKVKEGVFIPRPETEILLEETIGLLRAQNTEHRVQSVLDIGTGSGCIAIALAKFLPQLKVIAIDKSEVCLNLAKKNALFNNVEEKIEFINVDIFNHVSIEQIDLIVSNPPYIPTEQIPKLQKEVQFEPRSSLDGGRDGLRFYPRIIKLADYLLKEAGFLVMEMGYNQTEAIRRLAVKSDKFEVRKIIKDYNNFDRIVILSRKNREQ